MLDHETRMLWSDIAEKCRGDGEVRLGERHKAAVLKVGVALYHLADIASVVQSILESGEIFDPAAKQVLADAFQRHIERL